ncbi:MAG: VanW family protein [Candidatus Saccharibacteria bacterium]
MFFVFRKRSVLLIGLLLFSTAYGTWIDRMERSIYGVKPGVYLESQSMQGCLRREVEDVVDELVVKHRSMPVNARLDREQGTVIDEVYGWEVDSRATVKAVLKARENTRLKLVKKAVSPKHFAVEVRPINKPIGYYHTWFYGSWERFENIQQALRSINNIIIWPGETFSFNATVGPRTPERGYRMAPVIGGDGIGFGGGVCQVTTTLYNAALIGKLRIVERHPHSISVPYIESGKDATVVYGAQDLKLYNPFDYPVIIKAGVYRGKISVTILGK